MKTLLSALVCLTALALFPAPAHADYLDGYTGNTSPGVLLDGTSLKGTVNFAVLDRYGGRRGDEWGTGYANFEAAFLPGEDVDGQASPALDTSAQYIYLYQVVNDDPDAVAAAIDKAVVKLLVDPSYITSWGYFDGLGFADDKTGSGVLTSASATNAFGQPHDFGDPASYNTDVVNPGIVLIGNDPADPGKNPDSVELFEGAFRGNWQVAPIKKGQRTVIIGFTTNLPPTTAPVNISCGHVGQPQCPTDPIR